ncbi:MAG: hypothetical protein HC935_09685 [Pseudanabaena sp. SU_2_4]|nr:hypothetical protein [Pseudanabaena sp. SU_2_4]
MVSIIAAGNFTSLTLRTHGFANPAKGLYRSFVNEADELNAAKTLAADRLYVGYYWPSEQPFFSSSLYCDTIANLDAIAKFLFALGGISLVVGLIAGLGNLLLQLVIKLTIQLSWLVPTTFFVLASCLLFSCAFLFIHRDRYRAIHYGAPDLAEFFGVSIDRLPKLHKICKIISSKLI